MGAREGMIAGSALIAICFLASGVAHALEPVQPGASAAPASAPSLPDFLDDDRLPALEEAWRANEPPEAAQSARPAETPPAAEAPPADRETATTVRDRAEELSRRFGATTGPAAKTPTPSVTIPPAVIPDAAQPEPKVNSKEAKSKQAAVKPAMPARKSAMPPAKTGAIAPKPTDTASTQSDFTTEKLRLAAPPPPPESIPPLPRRKSRGASDATATKAAVTRAKPTRTYSAAGTNAVDPPPDPKAKLRGTIMTNELSAFGWNSQPR